MEDQKEKKMSKFEEYTERKLEQVFEEEHNLDQKYEDYYQAKKEQYKQRYSKLSTKALKLKSKKHQILSFINEEINSPADNNLMCVNPIKPVLVGIGVLAGAALLVGGALGLSQNAAFISAMQDSGLLGAFNGSSQDLGITSLALGAGITTVSTMFSKTLAKSIYKASAKATIKHGTKADVIEEILTERNVPNEEYDLMLV